VVLRSKTPALVRQEVWGLLLAHFAVRGLMHEAALRVDEDPDRLSFSESMQNRGGLVLARVRRGPADGARTGQRRCGGWGWRWSCRSPAWRWKPAPTILHALVTALRVADWPSAATRPVRP
jgi:hypothetical protein